MKKNLNLNQAIRVAFNKILSEAEQKISTIQDEPLRQIMSRTNCGSIKQEFINALIYLRLERTDAGIYAIHYGYEQSERISKYYPITSAFIRSVYKYTSINYTGINIEHCLHTDWVITNCAELFEYIGDRNKHHEVKTLDYKPISKKHTLKVA